MPGDFRTRRESLRRLLSERELDAILVTDLLNIRYLTGFTGSNAALVVSASDSASDERETVICTDGRYVTQVSEQVPDLRAEIARPIDQSLITRPAVNCSCPIIPICKKWQNRAWTEAA